MDSAYDRTNPDSHFRSRPDDPPNVAATVFTIPSRPRLSKNTDSLVIHMPGLISSPSLMASPYRSLRAATVTGLPAGAMTGTSRRPYSAQAMAAPITTSTSVTTPYLVQIP